MVWIAICDDEAAVLQQTETLLKEYPEVDFCIDIFTSGEALLESTRSYEIILLDIDMPETDGIETARLIRQRDKKVKLIYITNYSDYTVFAFAVHAFAYLLKPLKKEELYKQLDEAFEYMQLSANPQLEFHTAEGILRINSNDILYFEYQNRKVYLRSKTDTYILKCKITDLGVQLKEKGFYMPHKSFVVNLYSVKNIKGYDIYLINGLTVPLSQKKSMEFRRALNRYLSEGIGLHL
ncbi:two component transcriptional regulator, LytTR family [Anaerocolumna jejuensis DSM 15929]|uniref:Stage 0 sporulation protein A homolog n=1 Tax=Anaerocolumna jejuensis DSM 15929 TaxID=1121322 RepID=A0A1M6U4M4_9FIRM|nr:LytTR family DNA-binding domain-containing protein [Anaerocolumna jejuensis]SHK64235.1 two component transcriptional regulator, LytTR family [Anaerocolumna jejuensis DSM 15929]